MRTRSSAPPSEQSPTEASKYQPSKVPIKPSKTLILPSSASLDARLVTLPNPRTGNPTRYFFCPKLGVYEFTVVASHPQSPRSTLYISSSTSTSSSQGIISKTAELLVATPVDILFFVLPLLCSTASSNEGKRLFQPLDDIIDSHDELPKHLRYVLYNEPFRDTLLRRVDAVSDSVEAGDEKMFRLNEGKLLKELLAKAEHMVMRGLPTSLEERFVTQTLVMPLISVTRTDLVTNGASSEVPKENENEAESQEKDAQSTTTTTTTTTTCISTPALTPGTEELPEQQACPDSIIHLQRLSTALSFLTNSYISPDLCAKVDELLAAPGSLIDFKPLHNHLKYLADLRAEALASRSLGDFSRKRNVEDEDAAESRAEKKRRKEEEEKKKKAGESRGVRELKKVNTSGMKKMSDFFGKSAVRKKKV